jgi:hypothetical protein
VQLEAQAGTNPIVLFDLDDTLFDTRYRRLLIIRDFITQPEIAAAYPAEVEKIVPYSGNLEIAEQSLDDAMKALGVENKEFISLLKQFNRPRIMSNEYLKGDIPLAGAVEYVNSVMWHGGVIVYVTARPGYLRSGSEYALAANGFPINVSGVALYTNDNSENPVVYKARVLNEVGLVGKVVGGFENEPENINLFKEIFPEGYMFFLDTRASSSEPLSEGIAVIKDYSL